jgi:N utilization substance protein B
MKSRTKARAIALQALFEYDLTGHPLGVVLVNLFSDNEGQTKITKFSEEIVFGIYPHISQLDEIISNYAPDWPLDQVASIDRNIIRIALWEFAVKKCTPVKVAINEAVELGKIFGSDSTPRFVNGVLGSLVAKYDEYKSVVDNMNK